MVTFVLSLATGCAVLPEPTASEVQAQALGKVVVPPNWSAEASAAQVEEGWLASFNDPELSALVYEALQNNPDLWVASARLEAANAQVDIAEAQLKPAISILGRAGSKPVADLVPAAQRRDAAPVPGDRPVGAHALRAQRRPRLARCHQRRLPLCAAVAGRLGRQALGSWPARPACSRSWPRRWSTRPATCCRSAKTAARSASAPTSI